jgi:hypothetical protein
MGRMNAQLRRLEKLQNTRNSPRVLNLIALEADFGVAEDAAYAKQNATPPASGAEPFFFNSGLNKAIFVKHNLRPEEYELFDAHSVVETKVIVPFDKARLELGGRSFFLAERAAKDTLRGIFKINPDGRDGQTARDMKVLRVLNKVPSFDAFVLREALRLAGVNVDPRYFSASYQEIQAATATIYADIGPLVQAALGKNASIDELERFVDEVWNVDGSGKQNRFFEALRIPRSEWAEIVFAWKALLYYRQKTHREEDRLPRLARAIKSVRVTNNVNMCSTRELHELKQQLVRNLLGLQSRAQEDSERLSQALVSAISAFEVKRFRQWLRTLSSNIVKLGTDVTIFDQVVSYYLYEFGGKECLDGVSYEVGLRNLNELVARRFDESVTSQTGEQQGAQAAAG